MVTQSILRDSDLPLGANEREAVGAGLQGVLVDLVNLALIGRQARWNLEGLHLGPLRRQLDALVVTARTLADEVAERAVAIGAVPDGQAETVAVSSEIDHLPSRPLDDGEVVAEIAERLAGVAARTRERMQIAIMLDPVTEDLLSEVAAAVELHGWVIGSGAGREEPPA